jgi:hypothetical protein
MYLRNVQVRKNNYVRKSQIRKLQKIYGPKMANPSLATFAEGPRNLKKKLQIF